jgi:hypothetical protein
VYITATLLVCVPIPVFFYRKDGEKELMINEDVIEHLIKCIDKTNSIDFW